MILSRLLKTRTERFPDLEREKINHSRGKRKSQKEYDQKVKQESLEKEKRRLEADSIRRYDNMFTDEFMSSNKDAMRLEDDFM